MQKPQQAPGAPVGNTNMATQVATPSAASATTTTTTTTTSITDQPPSVSQLQPPLTPMNVDSYFLMRLKNQVEFYFSQQNLARDTYLRGHMMQCGGSVPLAEIAKFPKVRELCATAIPSDHPIFLMIKALEKSTVVKISLDAYNNYWITPHMPPPPLDPSSKQRLMMKPLPHVRQQSSGSVARTSSPLSNSSYGDKLSRIIVTDIPTDIATEVVISAFTTDKVLPKSANPGELNSWYVTFASEHDANNAIATATAAGKTINGHPIRARIVVDQQMGKAGSSKTSPSTTTASQEGLGETDSSKSQNSNRPTAATAVPQLPMQQQNFPSHMAPPQGMPNNAGTPGFPYPYPYQPPYQFSGGRYPPHLQPPPNGPHGMQYPPQMFGYQQFMSRPFYGPNQAVFMRSMTDPGQMRSNPMMKMKNNDKNPQMRKSNRNKNKQQSQYQAYPDAFGGNEQIGQRSNRGSRESLNSEGASSNDNQRKNLGRNRDGSGQSGSGSSRRKTSPMLEGSGDNNFDNRMAMKGKKKKSKRRDSEAEWGERRNQEEQKTEIFDEHMFPALSPSKTKVVSEATTNVPNNGFSGYADALRQKNKSKTNQSPPLPIYHADTEDINEMVETLQISQNPEDGNFKNSNEEASEDVNPTTTTGTESQNKKTTGISDSANTNHEDINGSHETTKILDIIEPTPKEASEIDSKTSIDANPAPSASISESTTSETNKKNESSNEDVGIESEHSAAATGAWSAKRSFIDVVKQS